MMCAGKHKTVSMACAHGAVHRITERMRRKSVKECHAVGSEFGRYANVAGIGTCLCLLCAILYAMHM